MVINEPSQLQGEVTPLPWLGHQILTSFSFWLEFLLEGRQPSSFHVTLHSPRLPDVMRLHINTRLKAESAILHEGILCISKKKVPRILQAD